MRSMGRYFEGFLDIHPTYEVPCNICVSDVAMFFDINDDQDICLDCCDDIWFARAQMKTINLFVNKWGFEHRENES